MRGFRQSCGWEALSYYQVKWNASRLLETDLRFTASAVKSAERQVCSLPQPSAERRESLRLLFGINLLRAALLLHNIGIVHLFFP